MGRVDHNFTSNNRLYVTGYWNKRAGRPLQLGAGRINADAMLSTASPLPRASTTAPIGRDHRLHRRHSRRPCCSTCARAGRGSTNIAIRPQTSIRPSSAFRRHGAPGDERLPLPAAYDLRRVQLHESKFDDRVARFAALGLERGLRSADGRRFSVQPTVTKIWNAHSARVGYDFRQQNVEHHQRRAISAGRFQLQRRSTPGQQRCRQNDRGPVVGAVPARPADRRDRHRRERRAATSASSRPRRPGEFSQTYHHFFVQDDWRVNDRLTVNAGVRFEINNGMREVENRNLGRLRLRHRQPDRGHGAGRLRGQSDPRRFRVSAFQRAPAG